MYIKAVELDELVQSDNVRERILVAEASNARRVHYDILIRDKDENVLNAVARCAPAKYCESLFDHKSIAIKISVAKRARKSILIQMYNNYVAEKETNLEFLKILLDEIGTKKLLIDLYRNTKHDIIRLFLIENYILYVRNLALVDKNPLMRSKLISIGKNQDDMEKLIYDKNHVVLEEIARYSKGPILDMLVNCVEGNVVLACLDNDNLEDRHLEILIRHPWHVIAQKAQKLFNYDIIAD